MKTSDKGINLIKQFEGFGPKPYKCPAGYPTIGYGHVIKKNEIFKQLSEEQATQLLQKDLKEYEDGVDNLVKVKLTQNQFDALVSLVYNIGMTAFSKSTLLKLLNSNDYENASKEILKWNKITVRGKKKISSGLSKRRQSEYSLFIS